MQYMQRILGPTLHLGVHFVVKPSRKYRTLILTSIMPKCTYYSTNATYSAPYIAFGRTCCGNNPSKIQNIRPKVHNAKMYIVFNKCNIFWALHRIWAYVLWKQ